MPPRFATCDSIADLYVRSCRWKGRRTLFTDEQGSSYSGEQALDHSLRFACALRNASLKPGDVVAFLCLGSTAHIAAWFGTMAGGYVATNLHTRNSSVAQIVEALQWLGARLVVHDAEFTSVVNAAVLELELPIRTLAFDDDAMSWEAFVQAAPPLDYESNRPPPDSLATVILSSGTTGKPKGVMHTQASMLACALAGQVMLAGINRHDTMLIPMNPSFAGWVMFVLPGLAGGSRLLLVRRFEATRVAELTVRERVTILNMVPTMWRMVLAVVTPDHDFSSVRLTCVGGESPTPDDVSRITARFCPRIHAIYMAGESGNGCAITVTSEDMLGVGKIGSTGMPMTGADVRVVEPSGSIDDVMATGERGEIVVTGSSIALGYWREPELTSRKFVDGWWRSGDLGHIDEDGYVWVSGRADNVINSGGIKVHAEEIEAEIMSHSEISACVVVGCTDAAFGQRIEAYVVATAAELTSDVLKSYLKDTRQMSRHKVPKAFHFLDALPTGVTGKVDRKALRERSEAA
ncbi:MAG: class I adenylate-forming enzyme family protein [Steroidobacteraceae bacterium]